MRRPLLLLILLSACVRPPVIDWPETEAPPTPALLPAEELVPPAGMADPGPALEARGAALRESLGITP